MFDAPGDHTELAGREVDVLVVFELDGEPIDRRGQVTVAGRPDGSVDREGSHRTVGDPRNYPTGKLRNGRETENGSDDGYSAGSSASVDFPDRYLAAVDASISSIPSSTVRTSPPSTWG